MADVAVTPPPQPPQPPVADTTSTADPPSRPKPRDRIPSYAQNRMSTYSQHSKRSNSRPRSTIPLFKSSLDYAHVRDFAYPAFHPMHYGAPPDPASGTTTPGSEWNAGRRLSDPSDGAGGSGTGGWSAGPWGGDGMVMYGDPEQAEQGSDGGRLPSTSFNDDGSEAGESESGSGARKKHRKSKSYANMSDYERGRRRESAGYSRRGRASGGGGGGEGDMFHFTGGQQSDPAGRDMLRQSRGYAPAQSATENGGTRRDSHFQTLLRNRSYASHTGAAPHADPSDVAFPLDSEPIHTPSHSPQRQSIGPEDEELYAGRSLALYAFEPENSNELRLREGQVVMVAYRHGQGWLVAEDPETGEQGLVPEEYVRLLSELPHYDEATGTFLDTEADEGEGEDNGDVSMSEVQDGTSQSMDVDVNEKVDDLRHSTKELRVDEGYSPDELKEREMEMKRASSG